MQIEEVRLYRRRDVEKLTGLPHSSMYRKIAENDFPRPVKIGKRSVAWKGSDLKKWLESCEVTHSNRVRAATLDSMEQTLENLDELLMEVESENETDHDEVQK